MITLNTDLSYLAKLFNISSSRLSSYGDKSIDEIMEAEAANGNTAAANFSREILSDPTALVKLFQLSDPSNKYAILSNLNERDLKELLPLLEPQDMVFGLNYFTKDKLLKLYNDLPKNQLIKVVFEMFPPEQVMQLMPENELNKFLSSQDLDKDLVLKNLKSLPPEMLAQMIEAATGKAAQANNQHDLINEIATLSPDKYKEALRNIPPQKKRQIILQMTKEKPKLYELFSSDAYINMISQKEKPELVKSAQVINPEQLIKMMGQLPQDLLAIVMTQIDPQKFADVLTSKFKDVLAQLVAG